MSNSYESFVKAFYPKSGLNLNFYKQNQMQRRILSFINSHGYKTYVEFLKVLDEDKVLYNAFFQYLTINVSQFFRDPNQWKTLRENIIPKLPAGKTSLKLWSAGCSSGQEAYSLAITLAEYFPNIKFTVLATDIDINVIQKAKKGLYKQNDFISTPPEILKKYFKNISNEYQINDFIKQSVTFQKQDLLLDPFDSGFDIIACRNVVIYFTDEAKQLLYKKFVDSLQPSGILFTGSTEHLFGINNLGLRPVSSFFYQKQSPNQENISFRRC
jgi:chemotaxis protein methyltransferase CheR